MRDASVIPRCIVSISGFASFLPGLLFYPGHPACWTLFLLFSGFCPVPLGPSEGHYNERSGHVWTLVLFSIFVLLGSISFIKKSKRLAIVFASLVVASFGMVVLRTLAAIGMNPP